MDKVSIAEVAKLVHVGRATVSRALNNSGYVSAGTRAKIDEAVKTLGYRQNMLAKKLRTNQSRFVGLVIPDIANDFFARMAKCIESTLQASGYGLFLCNSEENQTKENFYITTLIDNQVEAIIITPSTKNINSKLIKTEMPVVFADRIVTERSPHFACVTSDNIRGGCLAAQKFIDTHAKKVIVLKDEREVSSATADRIKGFESTIAGKDIAYEIYNVPVSPESGYSCMQRIIGTATVFDAVFCTSDMLAIGAVKCLTDQHISVPSDVQLLGFDGMSLVPYLPLALSTIVQNVEAMGKAIGQTVLAMIEKQQFSPLTVFPVSLVERETTK